MERWQNKTAVVTGASSGIGAAVAFDLVNAGFIVVALARREERLIKNKNELPESLQSRFYPVKCDVSKEDQVKSAFEWIEGNLGGTDVLINNAGIHRMNINLTTPENSLDIQDVVNTNVMAVMYCVREAFNSMKKRNFDGHIVIVNSVVGHSVPIIPDYPMNIYPATKFAVTAMTETYRQEFINAGTKVKITSISPGAVETEAIPDPEAFKKEGHPFLQPEDVSSAILYALSTAPHIQIHELIIRPVGEKF